MSISGQTALVVGGSRGFGLDIARRLLSRGCNVAICARGRAEVERAELALGGPSPHILARVCDATDEKAVAELVEAVQARFANVDMLVTCAATIQVGPLENTTRSDFEDAFQEIFWTTYLPTMAVLPQMRARRHGHITHITSFGGKVAVPHLLPYCTAKFAATGFSEGIRAEVAKDNISVSTITPWVMSTGSWVNVPFKGQHEDELTWFAAGATLPGMSTQPLDAAEAVVDAIEHRDVERSFSMAVKIGTVLKALSPSLMATILAGMNRVLPSPGPDATAELGRHVTARSPSFLVRALDALSRRQVVMHNE